MPPTRVTRRLGSQGVWPSGRGIFHHPTAHCVLRSTSGPSLHRAQGWGHVGCSYKYTTRQASRVEQVLRSMWLDIPTNPQPLVNGSHPTHMYGVLGALLERTCMAWHNVGPACSKDLSDYLLDPAPSRLGSVGRLALWQNS